MFHGKAIVRFADGSYKIGNFKEWMMDGAGVYVNASLGVYEGFFKENEFEGLGVYSYNWGMIYEG